jgi:hypothetical protein
MKNNNAFIMFIVLLIYGCNIANNKDQHERTSGENISDKDAIVLAYDKDTLLTLSISEYDSIIKYELVEIPQHNKLSPDSLYYKKATNTLNYGSEQGRDLYYLIYARYLSLNDNKHIPAEVKKNVEELFYDINLFMETNIGLGSGFYHMIHRIPGYVNYELLEYDEKNNQSQPNNTEKEIFIKKLQLQIKDTTDTRLSYLIEEIDKIADTDFILKKAKSFLNDHYGHLLK